MQLSIIVPCYNEAKVLELSTNILSELIRQLTDSNKISSSSKIVLIDDGSTDETWNIICRLSDQYSNVCGIKLSRNWGHQNALMAALTSVPCDAIVSIDADLQDDYSVIEKMLDEHLKGIDIVYGVRKNRNSDSYFKRTSASSFYRIMRMLGVDLVDNHADFRLMSRRAIDNLKEFNETNLFIRGLVPLLGFSSSKIYYDRKTRLAGSSKYNIRKMLAFALEGITSFSVMPLRLISFIGFVVFILSLCMSSWVLATKLFTDDAIPGWASTVLPIYFLGGIQILSVGIIGEYLGRVYKEVKHRPRFIIESKTKN